MTGRIYGNLAFNPATQKWEVARLEPHVALRFKHLFPKVPKNSTGPFHLNANHGTAADLQWFIARYPLGINTEDKELLTRHANRFYSDQAETERILLPNWKPTKRPGLLPGQIFRNYQLQAMDFAERVRNMLLVDEIGLGKTYEGLGIGLLPGALPMVVVVEPHLQDQWKEKAESFIDLKVFAPQGNTPYSLPPADIYIFKYTQLAGWVDILAAGWVKAIVFDEIQQLRTGTNSSKGQAAKSICQTIDIRVGLSGTPLLNYGIEIFNIIDNFIRPGLFGSREDFIREWCTGEDGKQGVVENPDALGTYLRESLVFLRRTRTDAGQEAKQLAPHIEWVEPDSKAIESSEKLAEDLAIRAVTGTFQESGQAARQFDLYLRELTGISKAKATAGYVRMLVEMGTPVLLFGWHREVYRIWAEELKDLNPLFYTGSETAAQKNQAKKDFIAGKSNILIMSLRSGAGADGIQARCSTVVFGEFDWSPLVHQQCIGRLDRDGQLYSVFVFYVATNYGSDPILIDILGLKAAQSRGIVDPGQKAIQFQSDAHRFRRLAEEYLRARNVLVPARERGTIALSNCASVDADQLALI